LDKLGPPMVGRVRPHVPSSFRPSEKSGTCTPKVTESTSVPSMLKRHRLSRPGSGQSQGGFPDRSHCRPRATGILQTLVLPAGNTNFELVGWIVGQPHPAQSSGPLPVVELDQIWKLAVHLDSGPVEARTSLITRLIRPVLTVHDRDAVACASGCHAPAEFCRSHRPCRSRPTARSGRWDRRGAFHCMNDRC